MGKQKTKPKQSTCVFVMCSFISSHIELYRSFHRNGIVYSQCLRLRRIINDNDRLENRLQELIEAFKKSGYPSSMLQKISSKVTSLQRDLKRQPSLSQSQEVSPILIVSCHETDDKLVKTIKANEDELAKTTTFKEGPSPLFKFVKKTASNVGSKLSILRSIALGKKHGNTSPCNSRSNCQCCGLIETDKEFKVNGDSATCAPGSCKSKNVIYGVSCKICEKAYIGRTV